MKYTRYILAILLALSLSAVWWVIIMAQAVEIETRIVVPGIMTLLSVICMVSLLGAASKKWVTVLSVLLVLLNGFFAYVSYDAILKFNI